jgi:hypothetical protein
VLLKINRKSVAAPASDDLDHVKGDTLKTVFKNTTDPKTLALNGSSHRLLQRCVVELKANASDKSHDLMSVRKRVAAHKHPSPFLGVGTSPLLC